MSARTFLIGALAAAAFVQPADAKGFVALSTRNAGPLIAWYKSTFDLRPVQTIRPDNANLTVTILDGPLVTVEILARSDMAPVMDATRHVGIFKAGFEVDDLTPWLARWRAAGVQIEAGPFDSDQPRQRAVILRDPDGNLIQIFQTLP
jgi:catechol-2,3-dioxygenase